VTVRFTDEDAQENGFVGEFHISVPSTG
jgi:hypothetical protein